MGLYGQVIAGTSTQRRTRDLSTRVRGTDGMEHVPYLLG